MSILPSKAVFPRGARGTKAEDHARPWETHDMTEIRPHQAGTSCCRRGRTLMWLWSVTAEMVGRVPLKLQEEVGRDAPGGACPNEAPRPTATQGSTTKSTTF